MNMTFIKYTTPIIAILSVSLFSSCTNNDSELQTYTYCVYSAHTFCAEGPFTTCQENGVLNNTCPYSSSSLSIPSSSSVQVCDMNYETVVIGKQVWMAENLNCDVTGSVCYDDDPDNCSKYGRLYNWEQAMSVCSNGWHLPSDAEWTVLTDFVGGASTAGTKLKATSGWDGNGNGTDTYDFVALPGGYGDSDGKFYRVGYNGNWWVATEDGTDGAYSRNMVNDYKDVGSDYGDKSFLYSVRCLLDSSLSSVFSSSSKPSSSSQTGVIHGTPVDYEGETYETVVIGTQTWMARNLNYNANGSKCNNCETYGRLYDWVTAMALPFICSNSSCSVGAKHRGICPSGWHIPSDAEWTTLINFAGGQYSVGKYLKASEWGGNDTYGFAALPGGSSPDLTSIITCSRGLMGGGPDRDFDLGLWWSSSEYDALYADLWGMAYNFDSVCRGVPLKSNNLSSVRCLKD
ncbi:MAG: hypothetical protein LBC75_01775 [Fibromonadaceae bacterium]|jgi:uncharacterized protein (TIGR02145 family)|nr:hypothetical protein [Fibromonadaceae bacterium]